MTEKEFQHNMGGADAMKKASEGMESYFWEGYLRGLRRHYHGEGFGTTEEHDLFMALADEDTDDRRIKGIGYRAGFEGKGIAEAIKQGEQVKG